MPANGSPAQQLKPLSVQARDLQPDALRPFRWVSKWFLAQYVAVFR
jgi:hypothetical protein